MSTSTIEPSTGVHGGTEPGLTLAEPPPRTLSFLDQFALWANLGVSLLGPTGALFVLFPAVGITMSLTAALAATVIGSVIGTLLLAISTVPGAQTGQPAMVLLRGLFGARLSYLPTVLNIIQCVGWGIFELVVIAQATEELLGWHTRWVYVVIGGVLTTLMAIRPLGAVKVIRRYALAAVTVASIYFLIQFARGPIPSLSKGSWSGFWLAADTVIAVSVSWVPLAADYTRHSKSPRAAFTGSFLGYTSTQIACYVLGILAFSTVVSSQGDTQHNLFQAFLDVPLGWLPFAIFVLRELDESFTNVYSTVMSVQNLRPLTDRRVLAVIIGVLTTLGALTLQISDYQSFLFLIGSVFVPMFAVFVADYFVLGRGRRWNTAEDAPSRWTMLIPWLLGFCAYQLINPGSVSWWAKAWTHIQTAIAFTPKSWMSASLISFAVALIATLIIGIASGRTRLSEVRESGQIRQ